MIVVKQTIATNTLYNIDQLNFTFFYARENLNMP